MGRRSVSQALRRADLQGQSRSARSKAKAERRRAALGEQIALALAERDRAVAKWEIRAGRALERLSRGEGLSLRDACSWCEGLTFAEARRLRMTASSATADRDQAANECPGS